MMAECLPSYVIQHSTNRIHEIVVFGDYWGEEHVDYQPLPPKQVENKNFMYF